MPTALVTGASTGIGRATALRLADDGWDVFAGVRKEKDGAALTADGGERVRPVRIDVTDEASIAAAAEQVRAFVGDRGLDGLVNNAGVAIGGPLEAVPLDSLRRQLEINVIGQVAVCQAFLAMVRAAKGRVVFTGSVGGQVALPFVGPYAASKHALAGIAFSLRREMRRFGVWVAIVEPGAVKTPIWDKGRASADDLEAQLPPQWLETYGFALTAARHTIDHADSSAVPPEKVADAIVHALTASRPKARYVIGSEAKRSVLMQRLLPVRAFDAAVARFMKLND